MSRLTIAALVSALALTAGAPALAQHNQVDRQVVEYADLNTNSAEGADTLIRRIRGAAADVCGDRTGPMTLQERDAVRSCEAISASDAVQQVNHPLVTARYYGYEPQVIIEGSYDPYDDYRGPVVMKKPVTY